MITANAWNSKVTHAAYNLEEALETGEVYAVVCGRKVNEKWAFYPSSTAEAVTCKSCLKKLEAEAEAEAEAPKKTARYDYDRVQFNDPHPGKEDHEVLWVGKCPRCGGSGEFREFDHIEGGICFECRGDRSYRFEYTVGMDRKEERSRVRRENTARLNDAKAKKFLEEAAEARPEWSVLHPEHPLLVQAYGVDPYSVRENREFNSFVWELWNRMQGYGKFSPKRLSEKQIQAGADAIRRYLNKRSEMAEKEAAKASVPAVVEGKQPIAGTVYGARSEETVYGVTYKFGVRQVNGQTYWGTIPKKIMELEALEMSDWDQKLNGTNVVLEATVVPSSKDHTHGFYKRPKLVSSELIQN